jgi:hypothetical protein
MPEFRERLTSVSHLRHWVERGRLFAIVDATDTPSVPVRAEAMGDGRAISLYRGRAEEDLASIAPYLFQLDWETLEWITGELWAEPWGILVLADATLEQLRTHFRKFLVVTGPEGESWYFRFYDPRVLERFLPTCSDEQAEEFVGPVLAYGVTDMETYGVKLISQPLASAKQ